MAAASEGEEAIATLLLEAGADWRPAHTVCAECYPAWLHPLPHGRDGETALSLARRNGARYRTFDLPVRFSPCLGTSVYH